MFITLCIYKLWPPFGVQKFAWIFVYGHFIICSHWIGNFSSHYCMSSISLLCSFFISKNMAINKSKINKFCFQTGFYPFCILSNLPAKSATEEKKHRRQYEAMVAEAKKKGGNHYKVCNDYKLIIIKGALQRFQKQKTDAVCASALPGFKP